MLSVLIPVYNYPIFNLVQELYKQLLLENISFEILALDDGSNLYENENKTITKFLNCSYFKNEKNYGRAKTINTLFKQAKGTHCLILEADAFPENNSYIKNYITYLNDNENIVFGGVKYKIEKPENNKLLRWKYGHKREHKNLQQRQKDSYNFVFTWNLLVPKNLTDKYNFDESIITYGFEDFLLIKNLQKNKINILHIENYCVHNTEDTSYNYLIKSKTSIKNLKKLVSEKKLSPNDSNFLKIVHYINKFKINIIIKPLFILTKSLLQKILCSKYTNLFIFDVYRMGYYTTLK